MLKLRADNSYLPMSSAIYRSPFPCSQLLSLLPGENKNPQEETKKKQIISHLIQTSKHKTDPTKAQTKAATQKGRINQRINKGTYFSRKAFFNKELFLRNQTAFHLIQLSRHRHHVPPETLLLPIQISQQRIHRRFEGIRHQGFVGSLIKSVNLFKASDQILKKFYNEEEEEKQ